MVDYLEELKDLARGYVPAGERVVGAITAIYGGKVNRHQSPGGLSSLGRSGDQVVAGQELVARLDGRPVVSFPTVKQMAIVLTEGRLLVWSRSGLKGKPKAFAGEVPLEAIESASHEPRRAGARIVVLLYSGWEVELEAPRSPETDAFTAALEALVRRDRNQSESGGTVVPLRDDTTMGGDAASV